MACGTAWTAVSSRGVANVLLLRVTPYHYYKFQFLAFILSNILRIYVIWMVCLEPMVNYPRNAVLIFLLMFPFFKHIYFDTPLMMLAQIKAVTPTRALNRYRSNFIQVWLESGAHLGFFHVKDWEQTNLCAQGLLQYRTFYIFLEHLNNLNYWMIMK